MFNGTDLSCEFIQLHLTGFVFNIRLGSINVDRNEISANVSLLADTPLSFEVFDLLVDFSDFFLDVDGLIYATVDHFLELATKTSTVVHIFLHRPSLLPHFVLSEKSGCQIEHRALDTEELEVERFGLPNVLVVLGPVGFALCFFVNCFFIAVS